MPTDRETDTQTDRQTDMTKIRVAFANFANAPRNVTTALETSTRHKSSARLVTWQLLFSNPKSFFFDLMSVFHRAA